MSCLLLLLHPPSCARAPLLAVFETRIHRGGGDRASIRPTACSRAPTSLSPFHNHPKTPLSTQPPRKKNPNSKHRSRFYEELHAPGREAPFKVRGATYLADGRKQTAGVPIFELVGVELYDTGSEVARHLSRYLEAVRGSPKPYLFVFHLIVPGPPNLSLAFV